MRQPVPTNVPLTIIHVPLNLHMCVCVCVSICNWKLFFQDLWGILLEFVRTTLNMQVAFDRMATFTTLILPSMGDLCIFWNPLRFLSSVSYRLYHARLSFAWLELTQRYFIIFENIVKGVVPFICFSVHLWLLSRRDTDSCELILYLLSLSGLEWFYSLSLLVFS